MRLRQVVLVKVRVHTAAHWLVRPRIVNPKRSSAAVEAASTAVSATVCGSLSRT